jgi:hypothetical protein
MAAHDGSVVSELFALDVPSVAQVRGDFITHLI